LHLPVKPSGPGPLAGVTVVSPPQRSHHCDHCTCVRATPPALLGRASPPAFIPL
jgi:hypothetical protein